MVSLNTKVFVSFRGTDCRHGFLGHLCNELKRHKFELLIDEDFKRGNYIESEIKKSIENSTVSIAIISEDYASSDACLDELVLMLNRQENEGTTYMVLPVFYHTKKKEVKSQTGSFATALTEMKETYDANRVQKWIAALTKVADLGGRDVGLDEPEIATCLLICRDILTHVDSLKTSLAAVPASSSRMEDSVESSTKLRESLPSPSGCETVATENVLKALYEVDAFLSKNFESDKKIFKDLRSSLHILRRLTQKDGINANEKIRLSTLEEELTYVRDQFQNSAEGRKEVELEMKEFDKKSKQVSVLTKKCEKEEEILRILESKLERIEVEETDAKRTEEEHRKNLLGLNDLINECSEKIEKWKNDDLPKQKSQVENLEHDACHCKDGMKQFICGLLKKYNS